MPAPPPNTRPRQCQLCKSNPLVEITDHTGEYGLGWFYCDHCDEVCHLRETVGCKLCRKILGALGDGPKLPPKKPGEETPNT